MKQKILFFFVLSTFNAFSQFDTIFQSNKVNITTLVLNYNSLQLEKMSIDHYSCQSCIATQFPILVNYSAPADFGSMEFELAPNNLSFFYGWIIWMGLGQITLPTIEPPTLPLFDIQSTNVTLPLDAIFLGTDGQPTIYQPFIQEAQAAWNSISDRNITHLYEQHGFKTAIYLYTPSVGLTDWNNAKWVIFLYNKTETNSLNEQDMTEEIAVYPNPTNGRLFLKNNDNFSSFKLLNSDGKEILSLENNLTNEILLPDELKNGTYILCLLDENQEVIRRTKIVLIDE